MSHDIDFEPCPFCDGHHPEAVKQSWSVNLGPERETKDGKAMYIHIGRANMSHVSQEDVEFFRNLIRAAQGRG